MNRTEGKVSKFFEASEIVADSDARGVEGVSRRQWFKASVGGGLALSGLLDLPTVRAAMKDLKLSEVTSSPLPVIFVRVGAA